MLVPVLLIPLRARKLLWMLSKRRWRPLLRRGLAPSLEHTAILRGCEFSTVIDVGANVGQFAMWSDESLRPETILCFEPLPVARRTLEVVAGKTHAAASVFPVALGDEESSRTLHVTSSPDNSSLLAPASRATVDRSDLRIVRTEQVRVVPGDDLLAGIQLREPVLLKVDVQGTELAVLEGLESTLAHVDAVLVELSITDIYDGQAPFAAVVSFLADRGFEPRRAQRVPGTGTGLISQLDMLFRRERLS